MALVEKSNRIMMGRSFSSIFFVMIAIWFCGCLSTIAKQRAYAQTAVKIVFKISSNVIDSIR